MLGAAKEWVEKTGEKVFKKLPISNESKMALTGALALLFSATYVSAQDPAETVTRAFEEAQSKCVALAPANAEKVVKQLQKEYDSVVDGKWVRKGTTVEKELRKKMADGSEYREERSINDHMKCLEMMMVEIAPSAKGYFSGTIETNDIGIVNGSKLTSFAESGKGGDGKLRVNVGKAELGDGFNNTYSVTGMYGTKQPYVKPAEPKAAVVEVAKKAKVEEETEEVKTQLDEATMAIINQYTGAKVASVSTAKKEVKTSAKPANKPAFDLTKPEEEWGVAEFAEVARIENKRIADSTATAEKLAKIAHDDSVKVAKAAYADSVKAAKIAREDSLKAVRIAFNDSVKVAKAAYADSVKIAKAHQADSIKLVNIARADSIRAVRAAEADSAMKARAEMAAIKARKADSIAEARAARIAAEKALEAARAEAKRIAQEEAKAIKAAQKAYADSVKIAEKAYADSLKLAQIAYADSVALVQKQYNDSLATAEIVAKEAAKIDSAIVAEVKAKVEEVLVAKKMDSVYIDTVVSKIDTPIVAKIVADSVKTQEPKADSAKIDSCAIAYKLVADLTSGKTSIATILNMDSLKSDSTKKKIDINAIAPVTFTREVPDSMVTFISQLPETAGDTIPRAELKNFVKLSKVSKSIDTTHVKEGVDLSSSCIASYMSQWQTEDMWGKDLTKKSAVQKNAPSYSKETADEYGITLSQLAKILTGMGIALGTGYVLGRNNRREFEQKAKNERARNEERSK